MGEQAMRGASALRDALLSELDYLDDHLTTAARNLRANPGLCADELARAAGVAAGMRRRVADDLTKMLRRRADLDAESQRLVEATEALRAALAELETRKVISLDERRRQG